MGKATLERWRSCLPPTDTKAEIEAIRGVDVDGVITTLMERNLIRAVARKDFREDRFSTAPRRSLATFI